MWGSLKPKKRWRRILAVALILSSVLLMLALYPLPFLTFTGPAVMTIVVEPAVPASPDKYLGDVQFKVINPLTGKTIASGTITWVDNWSKKIKIPEGHPGYVYLALILPNETYYLSKAPSASYKLINEKQYWKVHIPRPPFGTRISRFQITVELLRCTDLQLLDIGNRTFTGDSFTTHILLKFGTLGGLFNLSLALRLNVSGVKLTAAKLNGSDVPCVHIDENNNDVYDANETIYVQLAPKSFITNPSSNEITLDVALTFDASAVSPGTTVANEIWIFAYQFPPERPLDPDSAFKIIFAVETAFYTRTA